MKIVAKIKSKYCKGNKVQLMLATGSQVIASNDGILYLKESGIDTPTIYKYEDDAYSRNMPFWKKPVTKYRITHLFKTDKLYTKFTSKRAIGPSFYDNDCYHLTFLMFKELPKGEALVCEIDDSDFKENVKEETITMTKSELEKFLYGISDCEFKLIANWFSGMKFVYSKKDNILKNENYIKLDDKSIIDEYNESKRPFTIFYDMFDEEIAAKLKAEREEENWKVDKIEDVEEFNLTNYGFNVHRNIMIIVTKEETKYLSFEIIYKGIDCFDVKIKNVEIEIDEKFFDNTDIEYTSEPKEYSAESEY